MAAIVAQSETLKNNPRIRTNILFQSHECINAQGNLGDKAVVQAHRIVNAVMRKKLDG